MTRGPTTRDRSTGFYAPELDGLRWMAVAGVMLAHFAGTLGHHVDLGSPGVRLFFVLSGFLISHLLLRARERCEQGGQTRRRALWEFFIRRIFRLWPLYFASLGVAYAFCVDGTNSPFAWHAFFATNHFVFHYQTWPALLSHYWTLAVEQQFYILWPFALLLLPLRSLPTLLIAIASIGPLARWLPLAFGWSGPAFSSVLLPACFDFFALGSGVAFLWRHNQLGRTGSRRTLRMAIAATVGWILFGAILRTMGQTPYYWTVYDALFQGIGFSLLIVYLLRFPESRLARIVRWQPFVYLGQISYGLYIWHNLMHRFAPSLLRRITGEAYFKSELAHVLYMSTLTIATAAISYHLFEAPMRRLGHQLAGRTGARSIALAGTPIATAVREHR